MKPVSSDHEWLRRLRDELERELATHRATQEGLRNTEAVLETVRADRDTQHAALEATAAELQAMRATRAWRIASFVQGLRRHSKCAEQVDAAAATPSLVAVPPAPREPPPGRVAREPDAARVRAGAHPMRADRSTTVSVIIPTRDQAGMLAGVLDLLAHTDWPALEVVIVDNGTVERAALDLLEECEAIVVRDDDVFSFPRLIQRGVDASSGQVLVLLNNDITGDDPAWLAALLDALEEPGAGIAGALLLYPDRSVQHIGLTLVDGQPVHAMAGYRLDQIPAAIIDGPTARLAVTGACLAMRRSLWNEVGGMEPLFARNYNDVDLCLRVAAAGYATVCTPHARLVHHESATRGQEWSSEVAAEWLLFRARWREALDAGDPTWPTAVAPGRAPTA